ncbi:60S ribosomal protein L36a/L44 [Hibiscus syriacus]|uniref:60S ribosomal protein L36a/L44 n=1 Tax=Hibiscus syriacus TaxID=106335 RepID=A0A6A2XU60_HIBSY|nr:60S ribosomal protein L36a/L44 [Hibiscus syriacus]
MCSDCCYMCFCKYPGILTYLSTGYWKSLSPNIFCIVRRKLDGFEIPISSDQQWPLLPEIWTYKWFPFKDWIFRSAASHFVMPTAAPRAGYTTSGPGPTGGMSGLASLKKSNSGPLNRHGDPVKRMSGPQSGGLTLSGSQHSGPISVLPATGLITSGPISSGPLNSSGAPRKVSGPLDSTGSMKVPSSAVDINNHTDDEFSFKGNFPKQVLWSLVLLFMMGFISGGFSLGAVHNAILLIVVVILFGTVAALLLGTHVGEEEQLWVSLLISDVELRNAKNGQFVKISGVVTCGNMPLESSFQKVPRCVYTSTSLYEYRGWDSKAANPKHRRFMWGAPIKACPRVEAVERHAVDFYISDFQSGLRALVKTGFGARVTPYVDDSVIDVNPAQETLPLDFIRWLGERNTSSDGHVMRIRERYIKEGSTVSVMGVVQKRQRAHDCPPIRANNFRMPLCKVHLPCQS